MNISRSFYFLLLLMTVTTVLFFGCRQDTSLLDQPEEKLSTVAIDGYHIPVFPTPDEQFNYTRSWFKDFKEKRAALKGVLQLYPKARLQCGMAALDLAYSLLGSDYRMATEKQYHQAIAQYREILTSFSDVPDVIAKSHWYMGWIFCDLLKNRDQGIGHYQIILSHYPDIEMRLASPVPWVSIVYPVEQTSKQPLYTKPHIPWSSLAAIEIIRHVEDDKAAREALRSLWKKNKHHTTAGIGLKLVLHRENLYTTTLPLAQEYIRNQTANPYLQRDIEAVLKMGRPDSTNQKSGAE